VSLIAIVVFLVLGFSPLLSVFWATVVTFAVSFLDRASAMLPPKVVTALKDGSLQVLNVAATCAAAGIIVGVVAKTGSASSSARSSSLRRRQPVADRALHGADRLGHRLAVPVTASYIICAVSRRPR
jgi:TRAP-type uncharacterized transport system fused permease subunit